MSEGVRSGLETVPETMQRSMNQAAGSKKKAPKKLGQPPLALRYPSADAATLRRLLDGEPLYGLASFAYHVRSLSEQEHRQLYVGLFQAWPRRQGRRLDVHAPGLALELVELGATTGEVAEVLHVTGERARQRIHVAREPPPEWLAESLDDARVYVAEDALHEPDPQAYRASLSDGELDGLLLEDLEARAEEKGSNLETLFPKEMTEIRAALLRQHELLDQHTWDVLERARSRGGE